MKGYREPEHIHFWQLAPYRALDEIGVIRYTTISMTAPTLLYKLSKGTSNLIREVLNDLSWEEIEENESQGVHLYWKNSRFTKSEIHLCPRYCKLNHIPQSSLMSNKDSMCRILKRYRVVHGSLYSFIPESWVIPTEYSKFLKFFQQRKEAGNEEIYISKPSRMAQGKEIFLFQDKIPPQATLQGSQSACGVIQRYVKDQCLIRGYKFDLRIWVLVTSFSPLKAFIYQDGLCRFATEKYDISDLSNQYSHLTNASINKNSPSYDQDKSFGKGAKWSFNQLKDVLETEHNVNFENLWLRIENIIILTLLAFSKEIGPSPKNCCFELYGFDILLDQNYRPYLLEVNYSPSLVSDGSVVDSNVKPALIRDTINCLQIRERASSRGKSAKENMVPNFQFNSKLKARKPRLRESLKSNPRQSFPKAQKFQSRQYGNYTNLVPWDEESFQTVQKSHLCSDRDIVKYQRELIAMVKKRETKARKCKFLKNPADK